VVRRLPFLTTDHWAPATSGAITDAASKAACCGKSAGTARAGPAAVTARAPRRRCPPDRRTAADTKHVAAQAVQIWLLPAAYERLRLSTNA
jgi:hypothetical protein